MSRFRPSVYVPKKYPTTPESEAIAAEVEVRTQHAMTNKDLAQIALKHSSRPFWRRHGIRISSVPEDAPISGFSTANSQEEARASVEEMLTNLSPEDAADLQKDRGAVASDWQAVGDDLKGVMPRPPKEEEQ